MQIQVFFKVFFFRCQKYLSLPAGCILTKDPANPCCKVPNCDSPTLSPTLSPAAPTPGPPGGPTPQPQIPTQAPTPKGTDIYQELMEGSPLT